MVEDSPFDEIQLTTGPSEIVIRKFSESIADEELKWQKFCIDNGIIISPEPTSKGMYPQEWRIAVSFMPNFKKVYKNIKRRSTKRECQRNENNL